MGINPELEKRFKFNPLGTTVAILLTFLLLYFLQSTVGPFASNATIRQNMVNLWDNTNWLLKRPTNGTIAAYHDTDRPESWWKTG